jgi:hypothetical protein
MLLMPWGVQSVIMRIRRKAFSFYLDFKALGMGASPCWRFLCGCNLLIGGGTVFYLPTGSQHETECDISKEALVIALKAACGDYQSISKAEFWNG